MDIFDKKDIKPMLIGESGHAFDSHDCIFELKLDGIRCIAYLDDVTELRNKRNLRVSPIYPELDAIHRQAKKKCILDGEVVVINNGKPDFSEIQRRALMSNKFKIELQASKLPVTFVAYDILYLEDKELLNLPLMERKKLLEETIVENERLAISRYIEESGTELYELTVNQDLEGVVAKRKDSKYYFDKRTKDWIKIKNMQDDDFVVCGYIEKEKGIISIVLGQYDLNKNLIYKGHVTMGVSKSDFNIILNTPRINSLEFHPPKGNEGAIWIDPRLVCRVEYMAKTESGGLRQPVYKGLRDDKSPEDCITEIDK